MLKLASNEQNTPFLPTRQYLKRKATVYTKKHIRKLNLIGDNKSVSSSHEKDKRKLNETVHSNWGSLPPFNNDASFEPNQDHQHKIQQLQQISRRTFGDKKYTQQVVTNIN